MKKSVVFQRLCKAAPVVLLSLALGGCVDSSYDLDNVSSEVTIGGDEIIIPLGQIDQKTLGELISDDTDSQLQDVDGVYTFIHQGDSDSFAIEGFDFGNIEIPKPKIDPVNIKRSGELPETFELNNFSSGDIYIAYPDLSIIPQLDPISVQKTFDISGIPSGRLDEYLGHFDLDLGDGSVRFKQEFDIPVQVKKVNKVYFGGSRYGSPLNITLALNGLYDINNGGTLDLNVVFPQNYELYDTNGLSIGNRFSVQGYPVSEYDQMVVFTVFLHSVDLSAETVTNGWITLDDELTYGCLFSFDAVAGYLNASNAPVLSIQSRPVYENAEIVTNNITIDKNGQTTAMDYTFDGIPSSVDAINKIAFVKGQGPVTLRVEGLDWLKEDITDITMNFSDNLDFERDAEGLYDPATRTLKAPIGRLRRGVTLNLNSILCPGDSGRITEGGQLIIDAQIKSKIGDIPANTTVMTSQIDPGAPNIYVRTVIEGGTFFIDYANSEAVTSEGHHEFDFSEGRTPRIVHSIDIPEQITRIDRLNIRNDNGGNVKVIFKMRLKEGSTFPVETADIDFMLNLKKMLRPAAGQPNVKTEEGTGNFLYTSSIDHWRPTTDWTTLAVVEFTSIEGLPAPSFDNNDNWTISLNETFGIGGEIGIEQGQDLDLEWSETQLDFDVEIEPFHVTDFVGVVDYEQTVSDAEISLSEISDLDLQINDFAISPVLKVDIQNPIDVPFKADIVLTPADEYGNVNYDNVVEIEDVTIPGGGLSHLVISTERRRSQYEKDGAIFIAKDLGRLLKGTIPAKIHIDAEVRTDNEKAYSVDLSKKEYNVGYDYRIEIPLEFGNSLDIVYEHVINDLHEDLSDLSGVSVESVDILADFTTSIPLDLDVDLELLDYEGKPSPIKVIIGSNGESDGIIRGHNPQSGAASTTSSIVIRLDFGKDTDLSLISDLQTIRFRLAITSAADSDEAYSALRSDQFLSALLRLRINGGITLDYKNLGE